MMLLAIIFLALLHAPDVVAYMGTQRARLGSLRARPSQPIPAWTRLTRLTSGAAEAIPVPLHPACPDHQAPDLHVRALKRKLDREFFTVALPAFVSLAAEPLASLVDSMYVYVLACVCACACVRHASNTIG